MNGHQEFTSKQRAYLRSLATDLDSLLQIGKAGVTPDVTASVAEAFHNRELLKLSVLKTCPEDLRTLAETVAARTHSAVVHIIGRKIVLYRPDPDSPQIVLPRREKKG